MQIPGHGSTYRTLPTARRSGARGGWWHPPEYYDDFKDRRTGEVFANMISVAGESEFGTALVKRFFPSHL